MKENAEPYEGDFFDFPMELRGEVSSGLGRAHIFMAQKHYQDQFKAVLENSAWPGTLNVDLFQDSVDGYNILRIISGLDKGNSQDGPESHRIHGFERDGRSFGGATAFRARISKEGEKWIDCAVLIPDLTRHVKTAEIISPSFLRESMPCKDGEEIYINLI
ncbi:MAG: DUF120 domain-containing protein [Candidatus Poseidoniales archaeon]|jgi:CTP-dependent riboflavin kinase|tara:strand:+ start:2207 stop:2689 length:483 start_codon:yes stop_codon:yes gene_type:complete